MIRKWRTVEELLPSETFGCDLLFDDGTKGYGWYYGIDIAGYVDGWMLDDADESINLNEHRKIVKWRRARWC